MSINVWIEALDTLVERYGDHEQSMAHLEGWRSDTAGLSKSGTMKAWMTDHHGQHVDTLQFDRRTTSVWGPAAREVDAAARSTAVRLDESTRDYKGMTVLGRSDAALVVADEWHVIAYRVST